VCASEEKIKALQSRWHDGLPIEERVGALQGAAQQYIQYYLLGHHIVDTGWENGQCDWVEDHVASDEQKGEKFPREIIGPIGPRNKGSGVVVTSGSVLYPLTEINTRNDISRKDLLTLWYTSFVRSTLSSDAKIIAAKSSTPVINWIACPKSTGPSRFGPNCSHKIIILQWLWWRIFATSYSGMKDLQTPSSFVKDMVDLGLLRPVLRLGLILMLCTQIFLSASCLSANFTTQRSIRGNWFIITKITYIQ
jgi:hypothetical protein